MHPTPYPELNAVLRELVAGIQETLGEALVGVCLQGSFAIGDFDRDSDVDFIAVVAGELPESSVEALQNLHGRIFDLDCGWAKRLEGSYFPQSVLRRCAGSGSPLWYLENGKSYLALSDHCNTVVVRWVVREHGVKLAGPSPAGLVEPIPTQVLRREIAADMRDWGGKILAEPERFSNRFYQSFIVLSYCRMLHDLRSGRIGSKRAGARWAKTALPASWADLIDRAWEGRPNPSVSIRQPADPVDFERTLEFVRYAMDLIARPSSWRTRHGTAGRMAEDA